MGQFQTKGKVLIILSKFYLRGAQEGRPWGGKQRMFIQQTFGGVISRIDVYW